MFFKNLFKKTQEVNPEQQKIDQKDQISIAHPQIRQNNNSNQCPFMNKKDEQQELPRGGCPFMGGSEAQKNPQLQLCNQNFDEPFVSKYRYFLSDSKIDFDFFQTHKGNLQRSRDLFNKYPIYLQHTLFFNSQDFKAVRKIECCSRFMAFEDLREKGNKQFNSGNFAKSLQYYQRAYSLFKWLDYEQPQTEMQSCQSLIDIDSSIDQQSNSKIEFNVDSETQKEIPKQDDFRKKYKQFFVLYCDENTKLNDGQQMTSTYDNDMRRSLMVQILMNLASSYIMLNHYYLAYTCCIEAQQLTDKMSQIQFRKAQCITLNRSASLSKLKEAKQIIEIALKKRLNEKIFNETNPNILKMLNLHDSEQAYNKCLQKIQIRIEKIVQSKLEIQKRVFDRAAQIHEAEQDIISRGMQPQQKMLQTSVQDTVQFRVVQKMKQKYIRVIDFYTQSQKPQQVKTAKREIQQVLRVSKQIHLIAQISIQDCPNDQEIGDKSSDKILRRFQKVKLEQSEQIYNQGRFNFQVLEWAIKQVIQEDKKKVELQKQASIDQQPVKSQSKAKYLWLLILLPVLTIFFNRFILH